MHILVDETTMDVGPSAGTEVVAAPGLVPSACSRSVVCVDVVVCGDVAAAVETLGFSVEISVSGGWDVNAGPSVSSVVLSDVTGSLRVVVGTPVVTVAAVGVGAGVGAVTAVWRGTVVVVSGCSVVLAVATTTAGVLTTVGGVPGVAVMLGAPVVRPTAVDVTAGGLVAMVTLVETGLIVSLSVDVNIGVTLVVAGSVAVVTRVVGRAAVVLVVAVVVVAGVAVAGVVAAVDGNRVVTLSGGVVGLGSAEEVVVGSSVDEYGGGVVVAVTDTSAPPVTWCVVTVTGSTVTGL